MRMVALGEATNLLRALMLQRHEVVAIAQFWMQHFDHHVLLGGSVNGAITNREAADDGRRLDLVFALEGSPDL